MKLHGCCGRDRDNTVWCSFQLAEEPIRSRVDAFKMWLRSQLSGKDLLIIGFWSDWRYLNRILEECVSGIEPRAIILVDPDTPDVLQLKAPRLWEWANSENVRFRHIVESGADFLDELRRRFCSRYFLNLLQNSKATYEEITGEEYPQDISLDQSISTSDIYSLRRDCCGVPTTQIVRSKRPQANQSLIGAVHLLLTANGANLSGPFYTWKGQSFRLVNGIGQTLSAVKARFSNEPPTDTAIDKTVCVGAYDDGGVPANLVKSGSKSGIVRSGSNDNWITDRALIDELTTEMEGNN